MGTHAKNSHMEKAKKSTDPYGYSGDVLTVHMVMWTNHTRDMPKEAPELHGQSTNVDNLCIVIITIVSSHTQATRSETPPPRSNVEESAKLPVFTCRLKIDSFGFPLQV